MKIKIHEINQSKIKYQVKTWYKEQINNNSTNNTK